MLLGIIQVPLWFILALELLYKDISHIFSFGGKLHKGCPSGSGIKQGCTASGSIFAFSSHGGLVLLNAIRKVINQCFADVFESGTDYREKLITLRNSYFPTKQVTSTQSDGSDFITEENESPVQATGSMANYLSTLQRVAKK